MGFEFFHMGFELFLMGFELFFMGFVTGTLFQLKLNTLILLTIYLIS